MTVAMIIMGVEGWFIETEVERYPKYFISLWASYFGWKHCQCNLFICRLQERRRPNSLLFWEDWTRAAFRPMEGGCTFFPRFNLFQIIGFFQKTVEPVMTAYKLVTIQFKWWETIPVKVLQTGASDEMQNCFKPNGDDVCHTVVMQLSYFCNMVVIKSDVNSGSGGVFRTELRISSTPQNGDFSQTFTDRLKTKQRKKIDTIFTDKQRK